MNQSFHGIEKILIRIAVLCILTQKMHHMSIANVSIRNF